MKDVKNWRDRYNPIVQEKTDPIPMASPVKFRSPEPMHLRIRRMIHAEQQRLAAFSDAPETALEASDFTLDDEGPMTPYELVQDPETGLELTQEEAKILAEERAEAEKLISERIAQRKKMKKKAFKPPSEEAEDLEA